MNIIRKIKAWLRGTDKPLASTQPPIPLGAKVSWQWQYLYAARQDVVVQTGVVIGLVPPGVLHIPSEYDKEHLDGHVWRGVDVTVRAHASKDANVWRYVIACTDSTWITCLAVTSDNKLRRV